MNATSAGERFAVALLSADAPRVKAARIRSRGSMAPHLRRVARVLREDRHVLVAAAREPDQDPFATIRRGPALRARERVRALERGQDALGRATLAERGERLVVARGHVLDATDRLQERVLRSNARIIEAGRDRMRLLDLAVRVVKQHRERTVQHAGLAGEHRRGVLAERGPAAAGLDAVERDAAIGEEAMEETDRIAAAADAGERGIGQAGDLVDLR